MLLFLFVGLKNGYARLVIAHITFNLPFVIFSVLPKVRQSRICSTRPRSTRLPRRCSDPQGRRADIMPGIVSGLILAFTLSIDDL
jgi:spermidine/putrescine transport system permease protein